MPTLPPAVVPVRLSDCPVWRVISAEKMPGSALPSPPKPGPQRRCSCARRRFRSLSPAASAFASLPGARAGRQPYLIDRKEAPRRSAAAPRSDGVRTHRWQNLVVVGHLVVVIVIVVMIHVVEVDRNATVGAIAADTGAHSSCIAAFHDTCGGHLRDEYLVSIRVRCDRMRAAALCDDLDEQIGFGVDNTKSRASIWPARLRSIRTTHPWNPT